MGRASGRDNSLAMIAPEPPRRDTAETPVELSEPAKKEGSLLFHVALVAGLVPLTSLVFAWLGWTRLQGEERRWAYRMAALAGLDLLALVSFVVAAILAAQSLPSLTAPAPTGSGLRPRIGVMLEDAETPRGARVLQVMPGSPAVSAGLRHDDVIVRIGDHPVSSRDEAMTQISGAERPSATEQYAALRLHIVRGTEERDVEVVPSTDPFGAPLDAEACRDVEPDFDAVRSALVSRGFWVGTVAVFAVLAILLAWGRRKGVSILSGVSVLGPLMGVLFLSPVLAAGLVAALCPLLYGVDVRLETIDLFTTEVVLVGAALMLLWVQRKLGAHVDDEVPRRGFLLTLAQSVGYVFVWMPRALVLTAPFAAAMAGSQLENAPIAEVLLGARRTLIDGSLMFVSAAILAPIAEESLFRGVLMPHLSRITTPFRAIFATAFLFGILHIGGHGPLFVGPMFLGAILGWSRLRSRGLYAPIALHMLLNGTATLMALLLGLE